MATLSVDLAHRSYPDIGAVVLESRGARIECELLRIGLAGQPTPDALAGFLDTYCSRTGIRTLLLDGPQGWKSAASDLTHCRRCERELNTPAKTGLPGSVKPAAYRAFVEFSIAVFDALTERGWHRLSATHTARDPRSRVLIESFPRSAWLKLGIPPLPAKAKAKPPDLELRLDDLRRIAPLELSSSPTHDELQAIVAGLSGLLFDRDAWERLVIAGVPPTVEDGCWREGFILNAGRSAFGAPMRSGTPARR